MKEKLRFLGLDVHAETIAVAIAEPDGEVRSLGKALIELFRAIYLFAKWPIKPAIRKGETELPEKSGFYEQVTGVKCFLFFFFKALLSLCLCCCWLWLFRVVVLHRVSIRTLSEPFVALCRVGVRRRSRCCQFSAGLVKAQRDTQSSGRGVEQR